MENERTTNYVGEVKPKVGMGFESLEHAEVFIETMQTGWF